MNKKEKKTKAYTLTGNVGWILKNAWSWDKALFFITAVSALCGVALPFIGIFLPKLVLEVLTEGASVQQLLIVVGVFTLTIAALGALSQVMDKIAFSHGVDNRMRYVCAFSYKTMTCDYENVESTAMRDIGEKARQSIYTNNGGTENIIRVGIAFITNVVAILLYGGVLAALHPLLLPVLIALSVANYTMLRNAQRYQHARKDELAPLDRKLSYLERSANDFAGGKDIRLYPMSHWFGNIYTGLTQQRIGWIGRIQKRFFLSHSVDGILALLRDALAYAYLIYRVFHGLSIADFTLYIGAIAGFSTWLSTLLGDISEIQRSSDELSDLRTYLDYPDRPATQNPAPLPQTSMPSITFEHVWFRYPGTEKWVIQDFHLEIAAGEKLALVGVNGAGKTTLVKLLTGLYTPTRGRILIDGVDAAHFDRDERFRLFSAVFQEVSVLAFPLASNVSLALDGDTDFGRVQQCLELAGLWEKVEGLPKGMDTPLHKIFDENGIELSGGESQKLMLARALYKDAPIIVLDEPTAALDPIAEYEMYMKYNTLVGDKTSVFISHRLSSTRFCNRIAFIEDGRVAELGHHEQLMQLDGRYAHMFNVQSHYYRTKGGQSA